MNRLFKNRRIFLKSGDHVKSADNLDEEELRIEGERIDATNISAIVGVVVGIVIFIIISIGHYYHY